MNKIPNLIEAYLFWKNEPVSLRKLSAIFELENEQIEKEIDTLKENLNGRGIVLLQNNDEVFLGTSPEASNLIEKLSKEEYSKELSKAALETLAIIIYKGPINKSEIEYIRGVNSQFILRHLEIRGLIAKKQSQKDARSFLYSPSFDLLSYLGIKNINEIPEYNTLRTVVNDFIKTEPEIDNADIQTTSE